MNQLINTFFSETLRFNHPILSRNARQAGVIGDRVHATYNTIMVLPVNNSPPKLRVHR